MVQGFLAHAPRGRVSPSVAIVARRYDTTYRALDIWKPKAPPLLKRATRSPGKLFISPDDLWYPAGQRYRLKSSTSLTARTRTRIILYFPSNLEFTATPRHLTYNRGFDVYGLGSRVRQTGPRMSHGRGSFAQRLPSDSDKSSKYSAAQKTAPNPKQQDTE